MGPWPGRVLPAVCLLLVSVSAWAHDLSTDNSAYVQGLTGPAVGPFLYLGAKHMFSGYDHLLFLLGVIFFLYRPRDILLYVTLFTLGHSLTLVFGVWAGWQVNEHLIDAIIGLSVVYKAFDNIGGFQHLPGIAPDPRIAVMVFGLFHGLGLATRLQDTIRGGDGLLVNLLSFNLGVELGQLLALCIMLLLLWYWRRQPRFQHQAYLLNCAVMCAGFVLAGEQFAGYLFS